MYIPKVLGTGANLTLMYYNDLRLDVCGSRSPSCGLSNLLILEERGLSGAYTRRPPVSTDELRFSVLNPWLIGRDCHSWYQSSRWI
jgi:hypothetical protein